MFHDFHIVFPALYTISVFLLFLTKFFPLSICASKRVLICFNMNKTFISHANYSLTIFRVSWNFFPAWQAVMFKINVCPCVHRSFKTVEYTGERGYDGPLYDGFLHMTDDMLGPSPMHIKYLSYAYDGFCI